MARREADAPGGDSAHRAASGHRAPAAVLCAVWAGAEAEFAGESPWEHQLLSSLCRGEGGRAAWGPVALPSGMKLAVSACRLCGAPVLGAAGREGTPRSGGLLTSV